LSVILVTHDRYFLDEVCDEILEIDGLGAVFTHPGGWQTFLKRRSERFAQRASEVDAAKVQMKRAEAWLKRGPQGRGTKNKAQIAGIGEVRERASAVVSANDNAPELARKFAQKPGRGAPRMSVSKSNLGIVGLENATVVLVSHDRSLLDGVCDMYLVLQGGDEGMYTWTGSFAHLVEDQRSKAEAETIANAAATARANEPVARMKTPSRVDMKREQRKLRNVEKKIEDLEAELAKVAEAMQLESDNAERLMELYGRQQELEGQQTDLYEQWEALAENVEG